MIIPRYGNDMKQALKEVIQARNYHIVMLCLWIVIIISFLFDIVFICINRCKKSKENKRKVILLKDINQESKIIN